MTQQDQDGFVPLFDGKTLDGWFAVPRTYDEMWPGGPTVQQAYPGFFPDDYNEKAALHPAVWTVEDGAIVGRQDTPGSGWGGYLVSNKKYADFELTFEANPDWPADTGVMLRKKAHSFHGIQVLIDHRQSGSIGGFYGNGISGFHAVPFSIDVTRDAAGRPTGLCPDNPATTVEPWSQAKRDLLTKAGSAEEFLSKWTFQGWDHFRVRVVGAKPVVTAWINGQLTGEIDMAALQFPNYDADAVAAALGREGHIAFEVHDNDGMLKEGRWGKDAACRWRNVRIKEL